MTHHPFIELNAAGRFFCSWHLGPSTIRLSLPRAAQWDDHDDDVDNGHGISRL